MSPQNPIATMTPATELLPTAQAVRERIGWLLRELHLARRMLTLAKLADEYRTLDRQGPPR